MEVLNPIPEVKILNNVRLLHSPGHERKGSNENIHVEFSLSGDMRGDIKCFLLLDNHDICPEDKKIIFPLFIESMNILLGRQVSCDERIGSQDIRLSPPKLNLLPQKLRHTYGDEIQFFDLDLWERNFQIMVDYKLEKIN